MNHVIETDGVADSTTFGEGDTSAEMPLGEQLKELLKAEDVRRDALNGFLAEFPIGLAEEMLATLDQHRRSLLAGIDVVLDDGDLRYSLACRYVEIKAHWIQINFRIQYSNMIHGFAPRELVVEASGHSFLLGRIEKFVDPTHLQKINEVLLEPVNRG